MKNSQHLLYGSQTGYSLVVAMQNQRRQILSRLARGPADEVTLARWCDTHLKGIRGALAVLAAAGEVTYTGGTYALPPNPYSPAARITIPQYRWGATRLA